jgi:hypothetical protein
MCRPIYVTLHALVEKTSFNHVKRRISVHSIVIIAHYLLNQWCVLFAKIPSMFECAYNLKIQIQTAGNLNMNFNRTFRAVYCKETKLSKTIQVSWQHLGWWWWDWNLSKMTSTSSFRYALNEAKRCLNFLQLHSESPRTDNDVVTWW